MSLHDEFTLISEISRTVGRRSKNVVVGIGDDAAVVKSPRGKLVATCDTMVEGVHFDLAYTTASDLGYKALAVNLSDLAAMGARPLYALVSLGLKQEMSNDFVLGIYEGMKGLAKSNGVDIIGGNLVQSPQSLVVDITLMGEATHYFTRSGAKKGDLVAVTGDLGGSAAGLQCLKYLGRHTLIKENALVDRHLRPTPRTKVTQGLHKVDGVTSMIDISDGFARDLHHIAESSQVGFLIREVDLPGSRLIDRAKELVHGNPRSWVLYGGEDYEILFTFSPKKETAIRKHFEREKVPLSVIGTVTPRSQGVRLLTREGEKVVLAARGWNHFVRRSPPKRVETLQE